MDWNDLLSPHFVWIVIGLSLLIVEFAVPGLVVAFFGLGALLVGALCYFVGLTLNAQIALFLLSSIGMLLSLRSTLSPVFQGKSINDGCDEANDVVGKSGRVIQAILHDEAGRIEFQGSQWRAEAAEDIPAGAKVIVVGRDNLTLLVRSESLA